DHGVRQAAGELLEGLFATEGGGREGTVAPDQQPVGAGGDPGRTPALPVGPGVHRARDVGDGTGAGLSQVRHGLAHAVLVVGGHGVPTRYPAVGDHHGDSLGEVV